MSEHTTLTKSGKPFHESGGYVKSVSVISTGTGEAHREHIYGTRKPVIYTPSPPHICPRSHQRPTSNPRMPPNLFEGGADGATSPTFHSNSPLPYSPPHQKTLKTPCKNQKSRTPWARPTPASTPAPALRIRYRAGSSSTACWHPVPLPFLSCVRNDCQGDVGKLRVQLFLREWFLEIFL